MPSPDMDGERPRSREDAILTENTDDFIIGDRVWVNGTKPGYIQYLGDTRFGPGEWAGVVLDDNSGKNDGSVAGVRYFQCEAKRGVFARLHKLTRYPLLHAMPPSSKSPASLSLSPTPPPIQRCLTPTRTPSPGARNMREGDRVTVCSTTGPPKTGVLRYIGHTDFAAGEWAGVELDEPLGKNDGTVAGKRYFRCPPSYGLFSPIHKVSKMTGSLDRHLRTPVDAEKENIKNNTQQDTPPVIPEDKRKFVEESDRRAQRLRQLLEAAEADRRELAAKLEEERKKVEELEFRIEEECIGKDDIETEREKEKQKIEDLERRLEQESRKNEMISRGATPDTIQKEETKRLNEELKTLRDKLKQCETLINELKKQKQNSTSSSSAPKADELMKKEEALLQTQLSLDNKKREVQNLLARIAESERELQKGKSRQSRQLDTIDDLNVKLQKVETKYANLEEELHSAKEKTQEVERRLKSSAEQVNHLESEKKRLETQLVSPESTPKEQSLLDRLQDREREVGEWRHEAENARGKCDRLREDRERSRKEGEEKMRRLKEEHAEEIRKEKKKTTDLEEAHSTQMRHLDRALSQVRAELESARVEAEARLSRQEARLQEAELRTENLDRLREQISRLQADRDLLRVEKEETWKRLQTAEVSRARWEGEASKATEEVNLLKSQVQHLRTEFSTHREDLVQKLAETKFDAEAVQELHLQIEEQRRLVEEMQHRLKYTEGERDQLQTKLTTRHQDHVQVENGLRQETETLRRRIQQAEAVNESLKRSFEAAQLLIEEKNASHKQHIENAEKIDLEKSSLQKQLSDLKRELNSVRNGARQTTDFGHEELRKEKEALEQQVHFMNSVIVDMQHKNDDLRSRLDILETEVLFDGHLQLGLPRPSTSRLFCDICDVFDIHDTEDCPKQRNHSVRRNLSYSSQESEF